MRSNTIFKKKKIFQHKKAHNFRTDWLSSNLTADLNSECKIKSRTVVERGAASQYRRKKLFSCKNLQKSKKSLLNFHCESSRMWVGSTQSVFLDLVWPSESKSIVRFEFAQSKKKLQGFWRSKPSNLKEPKSKVLRETG